MGNGPGHLSDYTHRIQSSIMKRRSYHRAIESEVVEEVPQDHSPHGTHGLHSPHSTHHSQASTYVIPTGHGRAPRASYDVDGNYYSATIHYCT